jgi:integrase/recombinase XerC
MNHDLGRVVAGLAPAWAGFLTDWDRSLRSNNYPHDPVQLPARCGQLARYVAEQAGGPDSEGPAQTPGAVTRQHIEAFQAWMIETRSAATALNKHKALQQFFKWLMVDEEEIDRSPTLRVRQPKTPKRLIPIMRDDDTKKILDTCKGKEFVQLRDAGDHSSAVQHRRPAVRGGQPRP